MSQPSEPDTANGSERPGSSGASAPPPPAGARPPATSVDAFPRWLRQLAQYLPICSQFVVEGNTRDVHLVRSEDGLLLQPVVSCLWELLREQGCEGLLIYDRVSGIRVFPDDRRQVIEQKLGTPPGRQGRNELQSLEALQQRLFDVSACRELCCAFVIEYASRLVKSANDLEDAEYGFFTRAASSPTRRTSCAGRHGAAGVQSHRLAGRPG